MRIGKLSQVGNRAILYQAPAAGPRYGGEIHGIRGSAQGRPESHPSPYADPGTFGDHRCPAHAGLELTQKQLLKVAADNGLEVVDPQGTAFNPDHHQAISQSEAVGVAPGTVTNVFQKGYLLNGRLLRPALVVVARHED